MSLFKKVMIVLKDSDHLGELIQKFQHYLGHDQYDATILFLHAPFKAAFKQIEDDFKTAHTDQIRSVFAKSGFEKAPKVVFESGAPASVKVIDQARDGGYDLVVKIAEQDNKNERFKLRSFDMSLLRKCPCPVLLIQNTAITGKGVIAAAIDPTNEENNIVALNHKLLKSASALASNASQDFETISCWSLEYEDYFRHSAFGKVPEAELNAMLEKEQEQNRKGVDALCKGAGLDAENTLVFKKGKADDEIPPYTEERPVDLLVMGTVARTGIEGFIMGNTAENILQNVSCDILAVKPEGFK